MSQRFEWTAQRDGDQVAITMAGPVDEDTDFAPLLEELANDASVALDLAGVKRINSCGVREWVNFVRALAEGRTIELRRCSPVIVSQLNMISNFTGGAQVTSVFAPYVCDACGHEKEVLLEVSSGEVPTLDSPACDKCQAEMEFDDIEDAYFAFARG